METFDYTSELFSMVLSLACIIGCIIFLSFFLKRILKKRIAIGNQDNKIKIIERRALSPKASLYLIEVHGKTLIIAESQAGITSIGELKAEDVPFSHEKEDTKPLSFASILKQKFTIKKLAKERT